MTTQLIIDTTNEHPSPAPISMTMTAGLVLVRVAPSAHRATAGEPTSPPPRIQPAAVNAGIPDEEAITWQDAEWQ